MRQYTRAGINTSPSSSSIDSLRTFRVTLRKTEILLRVQRSEIGEYFTTVQASRWHALYLFTEWSRNSEDVSRGESGVLLFT